MFYFRRWGNRMLPTPGFRSPLYWRSWKRARPTGHACCQQEPGLGALLWAAGIAALARVSGSGKRCFVCPDLVRRAIEGCTKGLEGAFLWRSDTVSFGKTKEMGSEKSYSKGGAFGPLTGNSSYPFPVGM